MVAQGTSIEWTDVSWNPVHGCSKVSPGCAHCYAEALSLRYGQTRASWTPENVAVNVLLKPHKLREPLSSAKDWRGLGAAAAVAGKVDGKLVFVNSMSDLFHEQIPDEYIARVFATMALAQRHTFQVLTKRPERMRALLGDPVFWLQVRVAGKGHGSRSVSVAERAAVEDATSSTPLPNVWLGVSIENRRFIGRADDLRATPAAVRFISAEPLLGPLVAHLRSDAWPCMWWDRRGDLVATEESDHGLDLTGIDWVIVGGESGPGHRPMRLEWARDLRDACRATRDCPNALCVDGWVPYSRNESGGAAPIVCRVHPRGTAFFMKQTGGSRPGTALEALPEDLRIRDFPGAV